MAEFTAKSIIELGPNQPGSGQVRLCAIQGASAANSDTFTVSNLTTVRGATLLATDGTAGTMTLATNVLTVTNAGAKTWNGLAWGV